MLTLEYLKDKTEQLQKVTGCLLCIAGGAPRDILNEREVNDIDVFLALGNDTSVSEITEVLTAELNMDFTQVTGQLDASGTGNATVYEATWEGHKWQFIFSFGHYDSLQGFANDTIKGFDYGLCQVAVVPYQGAPEQYTCTREYIIDAEHNKSITRNPNLSLANFMSDKAKARLKKLQEKYPDFTVEPLRPREVNRDDSLDRQRRLLADIRAAQQQMLANGEPGQAPYPAPSPIAPGSERINRHWDTEPTGIPSNSARTYRWIDEIVAAPDFIPTTSNDTSDWMTTTVTTRRA